VSEPDLSTIRDLLVRSDTLATAGQPPEAELSAVATRGFVEVSRLISPELLVEIEADADAIVGRPGELT
jgi:hypothetical protein